MKGGCAIACDECGGGVRLRGAEVRSRGLATRGAAFIHEGGGSQQKGGACEEQHSPQERDKGDHLQVSEAQQLLGWERPPPLAL